MRDPKQSPLESIVGLLIPPVRREEVLGDLRERNSSPQEYLLDAMRTVPHVVASEIQRAVPLPLFCGQAALLYGVFTAGVFFLPGKRGLAFLIDEHGPLRILTPAMMALAALVVGDTYSTAKRGRLYQLRLVGLAIGIACVANLLLALFAKNWAVPGLVMFAGAVYSFVFLFPVRCHFMGLWKRRRGGVAQAPLSLKTIRSSAEAFEKEIRRRMFLGYLLLAGLAAFFIWFGMVALNAFQRAGAFGTVAGGLFMAWQLYRRALTPIPEDATTENLIRSYRVELARQRDFHRGVWLWSRLLVFAPWPFVFLSGERLAHPELSAAWYAEMAAFLVLGSLAVPMNLKTARNYQKRIGELDAIEKS
jgi:hypothetical protein